MAFSSRKKPLLTGVARLATITHLAKVTAILLLAMLALTHLKTAVLEQIAFSGGAADDRLASYQTNPKALYRFGVNEYLNNNDSEQALAYFTQSISNFSYYIPAILRRGEILADTGKLQDAAAISNYVDSIAPDNFQWRWDRTMLAYMLGQEELLADNLAWFITNNMGKRGQALALATSIWQEPSILSQKIGTDNTPHALHHFIRMKDIEKAEKMWEIVTLHNLEEEVNTLWYTNFLIRNNRISDALQSWRYAATMSDINVLIYNPGFQHEIIGTGFGWRLPKRYRNLLHASDKGATISFKGDENVSLYLRQLVAVQPATSYTLSLRHKTDSLTTDQRPYWSVHGFHCKKSYKQTEMVQANTNSKWLHESLSFTVPDDCQAVWVALRRKKSFHFDNKISGQYSLQNLQLASTEKSPSANVN